MLGVSFFRRFRVAYLGAGLLAAAFASAALFMASPVPAAAQGTLTAPAGQMRATTPGGMRGRAAMRHRHMHRMKRRHR